MSNEPKKSSGAPPIVGIVVGAILMVGGTYLSSTQHLKFVEDLEKQGLPLDPFKTMAVIGVFLILFPVLKSFFFQPLGTAIEERTNSLESTFTEAETLRSEMTQMRSDYEKRLAETEASAREQIQGEIKKAQELRSQLETDARSKAEDYLKKAQEEIDSEKNRAMTELRLHVVDLTLGATERVLGENIDSERNRKLIQEFMDKVEVPN